MVMAHAETLNQTNSAIPSIKRYAMVVAMFFVTGVCGCQDGVVDELRTEAAHAREQALAAEKSASLAMHKTEVALQAALDERDRALEAEKVALHAAEAERAARDEAIAARDIAMEAERLAVQAAEKANIASEAEKLAREEAIAALQRAQEESRKLKEGLK